MRPDRRTVDEARTAAMLALHGWATEPDLGGDAAAAWLDRLAAAGLPFARAEGGVRLFDPAEVIGRIVAEGLAGREPGWHARFVATAQGMAAVAPAGPHAFTVRFSRRLGNPSGRLRLPRPIDSAGLRDLRLAVDAPAGSIVRDRADRIDVTLRAVDDAPTAGWTARFTSDPAMLDTAAPDTEQRAMWLSPVEGLVRVTPRVRAIARRLRAGSDRSTMFAIRDWLLDRFTCGIVAYEAIAGAATDHAIRTRFYDCQIASALAVALARAGGIPARVVGGYLLWPAAPAFHVWYEAWLEGAWRPFDPIAWDVSAGGRDPAWRGAFAGSIDHRLVTQRLPRLFPGAGGLPAAHHRLVRRDGDGIAIDHLALPGNHLLWRDRISVAAA